MYSFEAHLSHKTNSIHGEGGQGLVIDTKRRGIDDRRLTTCNTIASPDSTRSVARLNCKTEVTPTRLTFSMMSSRRRSASSATLPGSTRDHHYARYTGRIKGFLGGTCRQNDIDPERLGWIGAGTDTSGVCLFVE